MALELGGEGLAARSGAEDEDVAQVAPTAPETLEAETERDPRGERQGRRDREEVDQEEAADIRQLEEEEDGQGDQDHHDRRSQDVDGLGAEGPARARSVQAVDRQDRHPAQRVGDQEARRIGQDLAPERSPVGPEAPVGGQQERQHRDERVGHREQQPELGGVSADHVTGSLGRCGPGGNGTDEGG